VGVDVARLALAADSDEVRAAATGLTMTIAVRSRAHAYRVVIVDGLVSIANDVGGSASPPADVTLTAGEGTDSAIARGQLSAQRAFLAGTLAVTGDATLLRTARPVFEAINTVLSANTVLAHIELSDENALDGDA
jgi:putative sterol carrier protein